jgi:hypothetical protein
VVLLLIYIYIYTHTHMSSRPRPTMLQSMHHRSQGTLGALHVVTRPALLLLLLPLLPLLLQNRARWHGVRVKR